MKHITKIIKKVISIDKLLDKQLPLYLLLILVLVLRIPNLFEPYWYGDEGIYLTIGQSMNKGAKLYTEIIDHKTPLIYYLARVDSQLNFRILNIAWMLVTTGVFYYFAKKLLRSVVATSSATLIFVIFTTLPWLEGHIPNGELFVLGFVLTGMLILSHTSYFTRFLEAKSSPKNHFPALFMAGMLMGLGVLTKVPAILDFASVCSVAYFTWIQTFSVKNWQKTLSSLLQPLLQLLALFAGLIVPIIASIVYFISIGSGQDYLDFGLLYNFRYAGSWGLPFTNPLLLWSFTLPGKVAYLLALIGVITLLKKHLQPVFQFVLIWFGFALFGALLSNRPYPHYLIQVVPAAALLLTLCGTYITSFFTKHAPLTKLQAILGIVLTSIAFFVLASVLLLLNFGPYQTGSYYKNWFALVTGKMTTHEYRQSFNGIMQDNYKAAEIITYSGTRDLFIWGTNPMLYALTKTQPTGRFTVWFHIADFNAYDETLADLKRKEPPFIVVMNNQDEFLELQEYISANYIPDNNTFAHFTLWKKNNAILN